MLRVKCWSNKIPPCAGVAGLFIRDIGNGVLGAEVRASFEHLLASDRLLTILVDALDQSDFHVRSNACYTLGKLCLKSAVPGMIACFNRCVHNDPLFMRSLLFETRWLEGDQQAHPSRIQKILQSPEPLVRWSAIPHLTDLKDETTHLHRLAYDSFSPLATEARYRLKSKLNPIQPQSTTTRPPTFELVENAFWRNHNTTSYCLEDLHEFVKTLQPKHQ